MENKKVKNIEEIAKGLKAVGIAGLSEAADLTTAVALGAAKTMKESTWEKKVIIGGIIGNMAARALDLDLPFTNLGIESMQGIDAVIDNASDVAMGVAATSLAYKFVNNVQEISAANKEVDELLLELGIDISDNNEKKDD